MVVLSFVKYGNIHNVINFTFSIPCDAYLHIFYGLLHTFSSGPLRFCQQKHFSSLSFFSRWLPSSKAFETNVQYFTVSSRYTHLWILKLHQFLYYIYRIISFMTSHRTDKYIFHILQFNPLPGEVVKKELNFRLVHVAYIQDRYLSKYNNIKYFEVYSLSATLLDHLKGLNFK